MPLSPLLALRSLLEGVRARILLGRTVDTTAGPQHPSYDINLSGTGDVVMTDVRLTSATLVIPEALEGRFFVRNSARELIVEALQAARPQDRARSDTDVADSARGIERD